MVYNINGAKMRETRTTYIRGDGKEFPERLSTQDKCGRCGIESSPIYLNHYRQCPQCNARDREERDAWVRFACAIVSERNDERSTVKGANILLKEFQLRFPYPRKP